MKNNKKQDRVFLDTNILIYTFDHNSKSKQRIANDIVAKGISSGNAIISHQVIQEFVSVAQNKFKRAFDAARLTLYLDEVLFCLWKAYPDREMYLTALSIQQHYKLSWWDSLIIAAALMTDCNILYSEDLQHGQQIQTVMIVNPFV